MKEQGQMMTNIAINVCTNEKSTSSVYVYIYVYIYIYIYMYIYILYIYIMYTRYIHI